MYIYVQAGRGASCGGPVHIAEAPVARLLLSYSYIVIIYCYHICYRKLCVSYTIIIYSVDNYTVIIYVIVIA